MTPQISVIIPVYNGEKYLSAAIDSVLSQTVDDFELIIINDGSKDKTEEVIKKYSSSKIIYHSQHNQGQVSAINYGIELSSGKYIALLDADDIFISNKLALQIDVLNSMPEMDMVFGHVRQFISPELPDDIKKKRKCTETPMAGYAPSGAMFRKTCINQIGSFDSQWRLGFFIDWYMRAKQAGLKDYLLNEILLERRIHDHNQGVLLRAHYDDYLKILKTRLQRQKMSEKAT
jgi:glycosyltransferase involved in cell wall biosynthesis